MSNKNLLNEATVRRFMKLANMETLTSPFVERLEEMHCPSGGRDDDEPMEEGAHEDDEPGARDYMEEAAHEDEAVDEVYHGGRDDDLEEAAHDELDADLDAPAAEAEIPADVRDRIEDALAGALEMLAGELDLDLEVEDTAGDVAPDMEPEPVDDAPEPDVDDEPAVDADEDDLLEGIQVVDDTVIINEVAKRVTARLVKAMAKK